MVGVFAALPAVNALLNTLSFVAIATGIFYIRRGDRARHMRSMWTATWLQATFLVIYVFRILYSGTVVYQGSPLMRMLYLALLGSHMFLAMLVAPLVVVTVWRGWRGRYAGHRRLARWTYPIWLYVTFTGPLVYLMLRGQY